MKSLVCHVTVKDSTKKLLIYSQCKTSNCPSNIQHACMSIDYNTHPAWDIGNYAYFNSF